MLGTRSYTEPSQAATAGEQVLGSCRVSAQTSSGPRAGAELVTSTASSTKGQKEESSSKYIHFILTLNASSAPNTNPQHSEAGTHLNYIIHLRFTARDGQEKEHILSFFQVGNKVIN